MSALLASRVAIAAALVSAAVTRLSGGAAPTVFTGIVRDAASGAVVPGAMVSIDNVTGATTDRAGVYRFTATGLAKGSRTVLIARAMGFQGRQLPVTVSADTVRLDIRLSADVTRPQKVAVKAPPTVTEQRVESATAAVVMVAPAPVGYAATRVAGSVARAVAPQGAAMNAARGTGPRNATSADAVSRGRPDWNREQYDRIEDNPFLAVAGNPRSTFSIDVDRAAYGNVRRFVTQGQKPPADAVRIEELVNYFPYTLAEPRGDDPVAITTEVAPAPWQPRHHLVRVALQARRIDTRALPANNLVFLIDVSGSMMSPDKLPLVKQSLRLLVDQLREQDRVALVVYAGAAGLVLPGTPGSDKTRIMAAIDQLEAGGSTAGGAGLELAYRTARASFLPNGNNRVVLATDGDFNVGASSDAAMERLIEEKRKDGTYLTVLGFGTGNYQDAKMEKLARKGNGNYAYVDDLTEARKTLVHEMGATLLTVANDVKLQVEFNPSLVGAYRLIGYEDRLLRDEDFNDDRKDAGDIGAGHTVTALYEIVPVGVTGTTSVRGSDAKRYTPNAASASVVTEPVAASDDELLFVKLRYKRPGDSTSRLMTHAVPSRMSRRAISDDFRFAAAVASFGMLLRDSEHKGSATPSSVLRLAREGAGSDVGGYRADFITLVQRWRAIDRVAEREEQHPR